MPTVKAGDNLIQRNSREFTTTVGDNVPYKTLLKSAESGNFVLSTVDRQCGFPDRLVLPIGHKAGVPYTLFVMVTPIGVEEHDHADFYHTEKVNYQTGAKDIYSCNGLVTAIDNRPLGFPFDRKIENFGRFYVPNMYFKDVLIFHKDATTDAHDNVYVKKNVNDFDHVLPQAEHKYVPSHRLMDEEIIRQDDDVRAYL